MKKIAFLLIILSITSISAQKEANFWYFGSNAGLDFTSCDPEAITDGELNTFEGCSTISNNEGELLFYSDGNTVWNKNHAIIPGGSRLLGNSSSTQSALFVPNPFYKNLYYLFVVGDQYNAGFYYYTIDLNTNGGLGSIIEGPTDLNNGDQLNWTERVSAIQSNKSNEFWIVSASQTTLHAYKVNKDGVDLNSLTTSYLSNNIGKRGSLKISPDGDKLVITSQEIDTECLLFDFNTTTGKAIGLKKINVNNLKSYGAEFSQSGNKLYISTGSDNQGSRPGGSFIFQYDLTTNNVSNINNSRQIINTWSGYRGALQLGPDARIYYAKSGETSLGVINKPEESGANVEYDHDGIYLGGKLSSEGLPPFIQSFFKVNLIDLETDTQIKGEFIMCTGNIKELGISSITDFDDTADITKPIKYEWYRNSILLTDETSHKIEVGSATRHLSGIYTLKTSYTNECGRQRNLEAIAEIVFFEKPTLNAIPVYEQCDFDDNPNDFITNFNLTTKEAAIYKGTDTVSIDFFEISDTSFSSPITKENYRNTRPTNSINGNHKLIVKVTNVETNCFKTSEIELKVNPSGVDSYKDIYTCELDLNENVSGSRNSIGSANSTYNFDDKTTEIIINSSGALTKATHNFNYFSTREDATLQTNEIAAPFNKDLFIDNDDIYVRISLKSSNSCESIGKFKIRILKRPIPKGNLDNIFLCINNPKDNPQLITTELNASTGLSTDTYIWYHNGKLIPNETRALLKANKEGTYRVEAYRNYNVNAANNLSCMGYNTFTVIESNIALLDVESVTFLDDQDTNTDNTLTVTVSGKGDYEYALNDNSLSNFEKGPNNLSYTFTNILPGLNKVYIRDRNNCGIVSTKEVSFVFFQRHFSPNNDGHLDTWKILGVENNFYSEIKLQIFDRYGKILKDLDLKTNKGWDGSFSGKAMPTNDYWYNAILIDINGNVRKKTGHFTLLR